MTKSEGYGHGDSAIYIGATPIQKNPKMTKVDHIDAHDNVLGYSGTNSRYVKITNSDWYNNGVGIVAEHARLGAVRADRRRRDQEQQHLLEQLQLLPAELAGEDRLERSRHRRDRPGS